MRSKEVKAAVMVAPGKIETQHFPYPEVTEDTALVRMELSGICGTDKHMYKGEITHGLGTPGGVVTPFPIIPGHENVGTIAEIGDRAARTMEINGELLEEGDRVFHVNDVLCGECFWCKNIHGYPYCEDWKGYGVSISAQDPPHLFGGWAEATYIYSKVRLTKIPEDIPWDVAVLTEPMTVAYGALEKAALPYPLAMEGFAPGDVVVIQGAGPLGMCLLVMARMFGAGRIIVVESASSQSEYRCEIARELGADCVVNDPESRERIEKVLSLSHRRGADLVVECAGVPQAVTEGLDMLRKGGTFLEMGNFVDVGTVDINPNQHILMKEARILGISGWPWQASSRVLALMRRYLHIIPIQRIVTHTFTIDEAETAIKTAMEENAVKVVITPQKAVN
jgi:L-iditol 2-dehydrogenase